MKAVFYSLKRAGWQGQTCNEKHVTIDPGKARKTEAQQALAITSKEQLVGWLQTTLIVCVCDVGTSHLDWAGINLIGYRFSGLSKWLFKITKELLSPFSATDLPIIHLVCIGCARCTLGGCSQWGKLDSAILTPTCQSCGLIWIIARNTWASNNHNSPADHITSAICNHDLDALSLSHSCAGSWQCGTRCDT